MKTDFNIGDLRARTTRALDSNKVMAAMYVNDKIIPIVYTEADKGRPFVKYVLHDVHSEFKRELVRAALFQMGFSVQREEVGGMERLVITW